jgi:hypothetical protein
MPFLNGPILFSITENPSSFDLKEKALQKSYKDLREGGGGGSFNLKNIEHI